MNIQGQFLSFASGMKLFLGSLIISLFGLTSCQDVVNKLKWNSGQSNTLQIDTVLYTNATEIHFMDTMIDLGVVTEGSEKRIVYYYQNKGKVPLMLFNVSPSCGCTIAEYSHNPLGPGETDSIVAKFDSKDRVGSHQKNVKVNCNTTQKVHDLYFKVDVVK